jgi:hypothetical protein
MSENPILCAIEELLSNTPTTHPWSDAGRILALCEKCPEFTPREGCSVQGRTPALFAAFLCDAGRSCPRWGKTTP